MVVKNTQREESIERTLQIPQRNVNTRDSRHENGSTAIKSQSPSSLPDVFDITVMAKLISTSSKYLVGQNEEGKRTQLHNPQI